ncbi:MAG: LPS assembly lipoprotein LptE [bacterium]|nr:LPS assembly lipoprotein LptE [bacterium]
MNNMDSNRAGWARTVFAACLSILVAAAALSGCERVAPVRTLPSWVRGLYVPMAHNSSFEPGLEEIVTRQIQEAFLADGRLDIVRKDQADLTLATDIVDWRERPSGRSGDYINKRVEVIVTASVKLLEPDGDEKKPMADLGKVTLIREVEADPRSIHYVSEPDKKDAILRELATRIMNRTIEGFPPELSGLPPGVKLPETRTPEDVHGRTVYRERLGAEH